MKSNHIERAREFLLNPRNFPFSRSAKSLSLSQRQAAIDDFLHSEGANGEFQVEWFDESFYREQLGDKEPTHPNAYLDFVIDGRFSGYYPNRDQFEREADVLARTAEPVAYDGAGSFEIASRSELARRFLATGVHQGQTWLEGFDYHFFRDYYPDYIDHAINCEVYALLYRSKPWMYIKSSKAEHEVNILWNSVLFDEEFYRSKMLAGESSLNSRLHFLINGARKRLDPSSLFSSKFYLERYPDIARVEMNPLVHYEIAGRTEKRKISSDVLVDYKDGVLSEEESKPFIILACHESSRTGAPIVGLRLAEELSPRYNVILWIGRSGNLESEMLKHCFRMIVGFPTTSEVSVVVEQLLRQYRIDFALLNSVETSPLLPSMAEFNIPIVSLIHEFADYTRPFGRLARMVAYSQRAIMPAGIVRESCDREFAKLLRDPPENISIRPQGGLSRDASVAPTPAAVSALRLQISGSASVPVVFGAGYVQMRKGVDWFLDIARRVIFDHQTDARFVWVGANYLPDTDISYGIWLKEQARRTNIQDKVVFFPEQDDLEAFWDLADLFLLPSRLDPFPNVGLDAIAHGKPIICFEGATGIAELAEVEDFAVTRVRYGDTAEAAEAVVKQLTKSRGRPSSGNQVVNPRVAELLSFSAYARDVEKAAEQAKAVVGSFRSDVGPFIQSGLFDPSFFEQGLPSWLKTSPGGLKPLPADAALTYQRLCSAGIYAAKGRPGFNEAVIHGRRPGGGTAVDLGVFSDDGFVDTHLALRNDDRQRMAEMRPAADLPSTLVHLHLYNTDMSAVFAQRLKALEFPFHAVVTTDSEDKKRFIRSQFDDFDGRVEIVVLENRGRDIGPFLDVLLPRMGRFDLVGHFHGKATSSLASSAVETWTEFLLSHLLPPGRSSLGLLNAFLDDPKLGLLFADDPSIVGWTANKAAASEMADRLGLAVALPAHPEFPVGNMFWARTAALAPLLEKGFSAADLPPEPIPYDGSPLHALERLLPTICEAAGFRWCTVTLPDIARHG